MQISDRQNVACENPEGGEAAQHLKMWNELRHEYPSQLWNPQDIACASPGAV
jgi:hypothetical protein